MWFICALYRNEYSNHVLAKATLGRGLRSSEEVWQRWVVIHIHMQTTQGISLYSYLYLELANTSHFYYLLYFFFYKIGGQNRFCSELAGQRREKMVTVQTMYKHVSKCKNDTC
jgi:hypothetical protein